MPAKKENKKDTNKEAVSQVEKKDLSLQLPEIDVKDWTTHKRLSKAKSLLYEMPLKKTGHVKFKTKTGAIKEFWFYELEDFVPQALKIFDHVGLDANYNFKITTEGEKKYVSMNVFNVDKPDEYPIVFYIEDAEADINGAQSIQNKGGTQSFQRRYLWYQVIDVVENDIVDPLSSDVKEDGSTGQDNTIKKMSFEEFGKATKSDDLNYLSDVLNGKHGSITEKQAGAIRIRISSINPDKNKREIKPSEYNRVMSSNTSKILNDRIDWFDSNNVLIPDEMRKEFMDLDQLLKDNEKILAEGEKGNNEPKAGESPEDTKKEQNKSAEYKQTTEEENVEEKPGNDENPYEINKLNESLTELENLMKE